MTHIIRKNNFGVKYSNLLGVKNLTFAHCVIVGSYCQLKNWLSDIALRWSADVWGIVFYRHNTPLECSKSFVM